jgi:very-short-patch-repair endonuclease
MNGKDHAPHPRVGGVGGGPVQMPAKGQFKARDTKRAKELRNQATPAERQLWSILSGRKLDGHKFSRQMPIGPYFADFLCRDAKLVVELDGYSHDTQQDHDARRDALMQAEGYRVLRFANVDVNANLEGVVQSIAMALAETGPPPTPPASGRGEEGAAQMLLGISLEGSLG